MTGRWPIRTTEWSRNLLKLTHQDFYVRLVDEKTKKTMSCLLSMLAPSSLILTPLLRRPTCWLAVDQRNLKVAQNSFQHMPKVFKSNHYIWNLTKVKSLYLEPLVSDHHRKRPRTLKNQKFEIVFCFLTSLKGAASQGFCCFRSILC